MPAILNLPQEVKLMIFDDLDTNDLGKCRKLCHGLYSSAHMKYLQDITLESDSSIYKFTTYFDVNDNPSYSNAVKKLTFRNTNGYYQTSLFQINREYIKNLLFKFSNLQEIHIFDYSSIVEHFDDRLCEMLLKSCPELKKFQVSLHHKTDNQLCKALNKVRLLLTSINLDYLEPAPLYKSLQDYIIRFPRLQTIKGRSYQLASMEKLLPIVACLADLKSVSMLLREDQEHFDSRYFALKTKEEQKTIFHRLASISYLRLSYNGDHCKNTLEFVSRYFTGLKSFEVFNLFGVNWTDAQQEIFCRYVLQLFSCTKNDGHIVVTKIKFRQLLQYLPKIVHKVFHKCPTRRVLKLDVTSRYMDSAHLVNLGIRSNKKKSQCEVTVTVKNDLSLVTIAQLFQRDSIPMDDVDVFVLKISSRGQISGYNREADITMYHSLIEKLESLKELILDIPSSHIEIEPMYFTRKFCLVEDLTLRASAETEIKSLLDSYVHAFPNLRHLNLYYHCGSWNDNLGEFSLHLPQYSLEQLTVDITPVKSKIRRHIGTRSFTDDDFVVIRVELSNEYYMYKVLLETLTTTRIIGNDLEAPVCFLDYFCVNICVSSLECLEICSLEYPLEENQEEVYLHNPEIDIVKRVILPLSGGS